jgi:hypothetical protein
MAKEIHCFCAFCRNPRRVYRKESVSLVNVLQALGIALASSYIFWGTLNAKALLIFAITLMSFEIAIVIRSRVDSTCPHCGFDPVLYSRNRDAACEKVKKYIALRQNDPDVWLARKPPLRFAKRKKKGSTKEIVV